jgi:heavy metal sensor kinase
VTAGVAGVASVPTRTRRAAKTIRVRLTLWYVALLACILVGFNAFLYVRLEHGLRDEADRLLEAQAHDVVETLDVTDRAPQFGAGLSRLAPGTVVALYERNGERLIATDARYPLPDVADGLTAAGATGGGGETLRTVALARGEQWRVLTLPVVQDGRLTGVLQVATSERQLRAALRHLFLQMVVAVPLTLLLAIAGGVFLAGRALDPIDRITRTAARIGAEDLSRRLNLAGAASADDEVGRLAATFDAMLERLDTAFRRQQQFTADASHELRTPLAILSSQIDVALDRPRRAEEYRATLESAREDVGRMNRLVTDLLTLARADAGVHGLQYERLDLGALATEVVAAMSPMASAAGVRLRAGQGDGQEGQDVGVAGDQTRLMQLLVNLVDNAIKYTPAGGEVTVSVSRDGGRAEVRVADTGAGIAPEHLPRLFERFYRVDKARSRAQGGTGLGLAICRWIAQAHGGEISVESAVGRGSTFVVRLPLDAGAGDDATPRPPVRSAPAAISPAPAAA